MNDRELLELAAKAAGLEFHWIAVAGGHLMQASEQGSRSEESWNPLTNDGDALRLAVKLKIDLHFEDQPGWIGELVEAFSPERDDGARHCETHALNPDPGSAVRIAIVRAAALGCGRK
jgi:hypothetical protein